jgi:steroid delta-isomerase-like uncharacterized protein
MIKRIAERWMQDIWRRRDLEAFDALHAPNFVDRSPADRAADRESYKRSIAELFAAFPDWEAMIDDLVVDEAAAKVAVRWSAVGTQRGEFMGAAPTGRRVRFRGIEILRIEGQQIVERWGEWDGIALLHQLGRVR